MTYTIENDKIKVSASTRGAELTSIVLKETNTEYLWQPDPAYWTGQAYNLFPICGRLWDGKYTYRGKTYEMNLHGFARKTEYTFAEKTDTAMTFRLADSDSTYAQYPFHFVLLLTYTLDGASVKTSFHLENTDEKELIYAVGGHPGFNVPLAKGERFEDYTVSFRQPCEPKRIGMSDACFFNGEYEPFQLDAGKSFRLAHNLFDRDAIFLTNIPHEVTLKSDISGHFVRLNYPELDFIGFWHKPKSEAPYICMEPWMSIPADDSKVDDLETKRFMSRLPAGQSRDYSFTITIG